MDTFFQQTYSASGAALRPSPIVIIEDDFIVLLYNGQRIIEAADSMVYHNLKMVSHIPLTIFMAVLPTLYGTNATLALPAATVATLKTYKGLVEASLANVDANPAQRFNPTQFERQMSIFNACIAFMSAAIESGTCSYPSLANFTHSLLPQIVANLNEAAADSINQMYAVMEKWRTTVVAAADWPGLKAISATSHMARRASMYSQFFARYFNVDIIQSDRFVTLESLSDEESVLVLLDTHVTDYAIGDSFFQDHFRMHQDALCGGANIALDTLFPSTANSTQGCYND